jgi:hypothetical protein
MNAVRACLATSAALVLLPAPAIAATATVTGDDGNPAPLSAAAPISIRNMTVTVALTVARNETPYYTAQVLDPAGAAASSVSACRQTRFQPSWTTPASYRGNGTYTVSIKQYSSAGCTTPTREQPFQYTVAAGTAISSPTGPLLTRAANADSPIAHQIPVAPNPGGTGYELAYARNGVIGADDGIAGASGGASVDPASGLATVLFTAPGTYTMVARVSAGGFFTPWSAPVKVKVLAPFDLSTTKFPDSRGPSYRLKGVLRERSARGKVTVYAARGRKGGSFRRLGRARITSKGTFSLRFTLRKPGVYRLRYTFKGSSLVTQGKVTELIRIRR